VESTGGVEDDLGADVGGHGEHGLSAMLKNKRLIGATDKSSYRT